MFGDFRPSAPWLCAFWAGLLAAALVCAGQAFAAPQAAPAVFGAVALQVGATPFDDEWARVSRAAQPAELSALLAAAQGQPDRLQQLQAVNAAVNRRIAFRSDAALDGVGDRWATPQETLARGEGDCEDYAILKMAALRRLGFAAGDLYLVVLKDLVTRQDHAVLAVRLGGEFLILDNRHDRVLPAHAQEGYLPLVSLSAGGAWVHGQRAPAGGSAAFEIAAPAP